MANRGVADRIRLVVLDWAGTTVDHGSLAPVAAFQEAFASAGVQVSTEEVRLPMGRHKKDHIREMLRLPDVAARWSAVHGRSWTEDDVDQLFSRFMPLQLAVLDQHSQLVPGVLECVADLRRRGMRIGGTTGYFREAAERVAAAAAAQGYVPDHNFCPEDVTAGRPAPWMIFRHMERFGIYPPAAVVKVGDTVVDVEEGRNAGTWVMGVIQSSNEIGLSEARWRELPQGEQQSHRTQVGQRLLKAGAHAVIDTLAELPATLDRLDERLRQGDRP
jgi:phosphonoacetaldehyde hydrolase